MKKLQSFQTLRVIIISVMCVNQRKRTNFPMKTVNFVAILDFHQHLVAVHKGRPQRRGGGYGQMRTHANRGRVVKDLADVRKMALSIVSPCFVDTPYG